MSVPNQKTVQLAKREKRDANHLYAMMNIDALQEAIKSLKGSGLKLWLYFNKNQDNYRFELSRADCEKWGIKKDSYYNGVEELQKKGFLVQDHLGSSLFWFHEKATSEKLQFFSETPMVATENQNKPSENPERNNTNNTYIIQDNTYYDDTAKGGIVIAIADSLQLPVKFVGVGEQAEDLMPFEAEPFVEALL